MTEVPQPPASGAAPAAPATRVPALRPAPGSTARGGAAPGSASAAQRPVPARRDLAVVGAGGHRPPPETDSDGTEEQLPRMGLLEHLEELRQRILRSLVAVLVAFLGCWYFAEGIFDVLALPIYRALPEGTRLAVLGVTDAFMLYMKVAGLAAIFVAFPYLLWQLWGFVSPGLYAREKRWAVPFVLAGWTFFIGGGLFAYFVAFPFAVEFLLDVGKQFQAVITAERYLGFLMTVILGLGVLFELPILIVLLAAIGVVTPGFLLRKFRYAVVIIFFVAALVTPTPDVFNLCLFALPTLALYLLGIGAAYLVAPRRRDAASS